MVARLLCFLLALHMVSWTSATSRPLAPNDGFGVQQPVTEEGSQSLAVFWGSPRSSWSSKESSFKSFGSKELRKVAIKEAAKVEEVGESKVGIGSSPPRCEHKCYGCIPCEAIQVPTTSKRSHAGLQYANYEPESWKCKCGPSFYSP